MDNKYRKRFNEWRREKRRKDAIQDVSMRCDICGQSKKVYILTTKSVMNMQPKQIRQLGCACLECIVKEENIK